MKIEVLHCKKELVMSVHDLYDLLLDAEFDIRAKPRLWIRVDLGCGEESIEYDGDLTLVWEEK